jgi:hypothetical protein
LLTAVAVADGAAGDRVFALAEQAMPDSRLVRSGSVDDIVLYREMRFVPITDLPPFAPAAKEAYEKLLNSDTPPHSRVDVRWILPEKQGG